MAFTLPGSSGIGLRRPAGRAAAGGPRPAETHRAAAAAVRRPRGGRQGDPGRLPDRLLRRGGRTPRPRHPRHQRQRRRRRRRLPACRQRRHGGRSAYQGRRARGELAPQRRPTGPHPQYRRRRVVAGGRIPLRPLAGGRRPYRRTRRLGQRQGPRGGARAHGGMGIARGRRLYRGVRGPGRKDPGDCPLPRGRIGLQHDPPSTLQPRCQRAPLP